MKIHSGHGEHGDASHPTAERVGGHTAVGGGKGDKKKQDLIVVGTLALVVIGYLTLKHMGSQSTSAGSTVGVPGSAVSTGGGGESATPGGVTPTPTVVNDPLDWARRRGVRVPTWHEIVTPITGPPAKTPEAPKTPDAPKTSGKVEPAGYGWFATGKETYTLDSIARRFNVPVASLLAWNPSLKGDTGSNVIGKNTPIKVRSDAGAWNLDAYRKVNPTQDKPKPAGKASDTSSKVSGSGIHVAYKVTSATHPTAVDSGAKAAPKPLHPAVR